MGHTPWPLATFDCLDSTNDEVKRRLRAGDTPPFAVVAATQTAGYGRQGRTWTSPLGGLYLSLAYAPKAPMASWPTLCLMAALAVRRALATLWPTLGDELAIKWPNDLVLPTEGALAKLCGISTETCESALCLGIGVNVFTPRDAVERPAAPYPVAFVQDCMGAPDKDVDAAVMRATIRELAEAVLTACAEMFSQWETEGFQAFVAAYNDCDALRGRTVTVADIEAKHEFHGRVVGIAEDGALELAEDHGAVRKLFAGEVHLTSCL